MALTDLYDPLDWSDTEGPGCAAHARADCLCDVDVAAHPVPASSTVDYGRTGWGAVATKVAGRPSSSADLAQWASELLGAHDAVTARAADLGGIDHLEQLRSTFTNDRSRCSKGPISGGVVRELLRAGWSFATAANFLGTVPTEVVRFVTKDHPPSTYLTAERLLRSGHTYAEVARATALSADAAERLGRTLGFPPKGRGVGSEVRELVMRLHAEGRSYADIEAATGVKRNTLYSMVHRKRVAA